MFKEKGKRKYAVKFTSGKLSALEKSSADGKVRARLRNVNQKSLLTTNKLVNVLRSKNHSTHGLSVTLFPL